MKFRFIIFTLLIINLLSAEEQYHKTLNLMGSKFDITVVAENPNQGKEFIILAIDEISRIEKLISSWDSKSQTSQINKNAGLKPIKVDSELYDLIERAKYISNITDGAFDISYASMDRIWKFDGSMTKMPDKVQIKNSVSKVGYQNIILNKDDQTVFLVNQGMKIGFGAIGKGYAADKARELLELKGVKSGIINASGDMTTWGSKPDGSPWMVGITNPMNSNKVFSWFPMVNNAVVTSGDYEKFITLNGIRFSHIINPRTGYPATGLVSVSVFAPKAELADALATSIFVMGLDSGINLINQLNDTECVIVDENGNLHKSNNIKIDRVKK